MRYFYNKPDFYSTMYGSVYICNHPVYKICTLFKIDEKGLAVIQQRFDKNTKHIWWSSIDPWLVDSIYLNPNFKKYFEKKSNVEFHGLYPTVTIRQIMWGLRMKPIKKERWETFFNRDYI